MFPFKGTHCRRPRLFCIYAAKTLVEAEVEFHVIQYYASTIQLFGRIEGVFFLISMSRRFSWIYVLDTSQSYKLSHE